MKELVYSFLTHIVDVKPTDIDPKLWVGTEYAPYTFERSRRGPGMAIVLLLVYTLGHHHREIKDPSVISFGTAVWTIVIIAIVIALVVVTWRRNVRAYRIDNGKGLRLEADSIVVLYGQESRTIPFSQLRCVEGATTRSVRQLRLIEHDGTETSFTDRTISDLDPLILALDYHGVEIVPL